MPTDDAALHAATARLMPARLAEVAATAGQRPPDLVRPFGCVVLGCGDGSLPEAVAAGHPLARVWTWDPHVESVEETLQLRRDAGLTNLEVHERASLPDHLDGFPVDVVIVNGVIDAVSDGERLRTSGFIDSVLRPGGLLAIDYRTAIGWTEIQPVVNLMRYVASTYGGDRDASVDHVLHLLRRLRDAKAAYITQRPKVAAWVDVVLASDPSTVEQQYLRNDLRPLSHAQVVQFAGSVGCGFIGTTHDAATDLAPALAGIVDGASTRPLRETYGDLAVRRTQRTDVFRKGVR